MELFKNTIVKLLLLWGRMGRASGFLYVVVERWGSWLHTKTRQKKYLGGLTFNCDLTDHIQQKIYFFGVYEAIETHVTMQQIQPGYIVLDAGANAGYYSLLAGQKVGVQGEVHSFEPIPENFVRLQENITSNNFQSTCFANNKAVWNKNEELKFSLSQETKNNSGTYSAGDVGATPARELVCQAITIDSYVKEKKLAHVDFIKFDVEGAELMALQGAQQTLIDFSPTILLEVCHYTFKRFGYSGDDVIKMLKNLGYRVWFAGQSLSESRELESLDSIKQGNVFLFKGPLESWTGLDDWSIRGLKENYQRLSSH